MHLSSKYKLQSQTSEEIDVEYTKLSNNTSNQDQTLVINIGRVA